ncbi:MAG: lysylphosphatidylglycerol synthase transmembrane domain-containing protein [Blastocatellia bacterium]
MTTRDKAEEIDEPRGGLNLRGLAQALIGIIALALVIMKSDMRGLWEVIKSARIAYLPMAVLASFAVTWLMAYRWGAILKVRGYAIKPHRLFGYYLIGIFFMNFVPGGGISGDVARLIYVDREVRDKAFVLSTLVYERLVGGFIILLIGLISTVASRQYIRADQILVASEAMLAVVIISAIMLMSRYISSKLARLCRSLGARVSAERAGEAAARTLEAISEFRNHHRMLAVTIALSVLIRIVWGLGCYIVALALGLSLDLPIVFAFISLVDLVRMLPVSVGGLGVREWLIIALFASVGIEREQALAFSLLAFAPIYLNAIAGGIVYVSMAKLKRAGKRVADLGFKRSEV